MDWRHIILAIAAIGQIIGIAAYVAEMVKGKTKPNLITWLFWAIWPLIGAAAAFSQGIAWAVVPTLVAGLNPLCVVIAGIVLRQSYWKLRPFDYICGGLALLALILWIVTEEPNLALALSIIGDLTVATPVIIKAWQFPETESYLTYAAGVFSALTSFLFVTNWQFAEIAFPTYLIVMDLLLIFLIVKPKLKKPL